MVVISDDGDLSPHIYVADSKNKLLRQVTLLFFFITLEPRIE